METVGELLFGDGQNASKPHLHHHWDLVQDTDEWRQIRCGLLTASEMKLIITPTLKVASNDKERAHLYDLIAQRITGYTPPQFQTFDMMRGKLDEVDALQLYHQKYNKLQSCGFITNNRWGFTLGYSPDGLIVDFDGVVECKSRLPKYQVETILTDTMPDEYAIQVQTALLVSERNWCDFISYCGGMPMFVRRVYADDQIQDAIIKAATIFHEKMDRYIAEYKTRVEEKGFHMTERRIEEMEL